MLEVRQREVQDEVEERAGGRRRVERREEVDDGREVDRGERLLGGEEAGERGAGHGRLGDEVEGRGEVRRVVVGEEEGDEAGHVEVLDPASGETRGERQLFALAVGRGFEERERERRT